MPHIDTLWRASFWLLIMRGVHIAAMLLLSILLSRSLGAEQYGVFAFGLSILLIAVVPARFGFDAYLPSELPVLASAGRFGEIRGLLRRAFQTTLAISLGLLALWLICWAAAPGALSRPLWISGGIALAALPCFALLHTRYGALRAQHRAVAGQLPIFVLQPLLAIALAALALSVAPAMIDGIAAQLLFAASIGGVCLLAFTALHRVGDGKWQDAGAVYATRDWLNGAAPMMMASGFNILIAQSGVLLLGAQLGEQSSGLYQPAAQLAGFVAIGLQITNQPLAPKISQLYAEGRRQELQALIFRVTSVCIAGAAALAAAFLLFAPQLLSIYGQEFAVAAPALIVLTVGQAANVACGPSALILTMTGHSRTVVLLMALGAAICIALTLALSPSLGILGAAIGSATALAAWNLGAVWAARRRTGLFSTVLLQPLSTHALRKKAA